MGPLDQARQHLDKAKEFLEAAELDLSFGYLNAATSNGVTSGVNSKDAMCLALTGRTTKTDDHRTAVKELEQAGPAGRGAAPTLGRLLALKTPAQYQAGGVTKSNAEHAVKWAQRMYDTADGVVKRWTRAVRRPDANDCPGCGEMPGPGRIESPAQSGTGPIVRP